MEEKIQQQIEAYLEGQLSEQEKAAFEAQIREDKALAADVQLFQEMEDLLGESDVLDFSDTLESVMKTEKVNTPEATIVRKIPVKKTNRRWLSLAAGFALVALFGTLVYNNLSTVSPDSLYANHIEFPSTLGGGGALRSTEIKEVETILATINTTWQEANDAYQQNQFGVALQAVDQIEQLDAKFEWVNEGNFYFKKGLVQLKLGQFKEAITAFEKVKTGDYISNAEWKKALALLKVDTTKAKIALQEIANANHPERSKATAILKAL